MRLFGLEIKKSKRAVPKEAPVAHVPSGDYAYPYNSYVSLSFDGEKNIGDIGPIRRYSIDYAALRERSWSLMLDSEICQIIINRFCRWVVGSGLKLQVEPREDVLASEGIKLNKSDFSNMVESRFSIYANDAMADYSSMGSLNEIAKVAFTNAKVGGDVLVILRYEEGTVNVQLIDGAHVRTPLSFTRNVVGYIAPNGNEVNNGVELDDKGKHVAYYLIDKTNPLGYKRISATNDTLGLKVAFLVSGLRYRYNTRCLPLISAIMESASKMDRYKEATLATAEERAKMTFFVQHEVAGTGENPFVNAVRAVGGRPGDIPVDSSGRALSDRIMATTNKQTVNLPPGAKIEVPRTDSELHFEPFINKNIDLVCAAIGIPSNVAMMLYTDSFSASRAAIKDWEHTLGVEREDFSSQFYQPIYKFWLTMQILENKIQASGYLKALQTNNRMALAAYRNTRWVGASVPHIDPLKEVQAERAKLGRGAAHIPLTTVEAATEALNGGDSYSNMQQYAEELDDAESLGIEKIDSSTDKRKEGFY